MVPARVLLFLLVLISTSPSPAAAQGDAGKFLLGALAGLGVHEAGHLGASLALGSSPGLRRVTFGPLPFFAITHEPVSARGEYFISSAGFWAQQTTSEILLTRHPYLRQEDAPFLKGIFTFHLLLSAGYSVAAFAEEGPIERDTHGMAASLRVDEPVVGALVLAPALLDALRYYFPDEGWLKWVGRGVKAGGILLLVRAGYPPG